VVTVVCRPGRGASQVEKSPHLNWATQFLTVAYDGARSPSVSFFCLSGEKKLDDSLRLDVVEITRVA